MQILNHNTNMKQSLKLNALTSVSSIGSSWITQEGISIDICCCPIQLGINKCKKKTRERTVYFVHEVNKENKYCIGKRS